MDFKRIIKCLGEWLFRVIHNGSFLSVAAPGAAALRLAAWLTHDSLVDVGT